MENYPTPLFFAFSHFAILSEIVLTGSLFGGRKVADEMSFMTNLTQHLSTRYNRPVSSIAVFLQHGACLLIGGTLEPAYSVAVHMLASLSAGQVATNKRNAALLQRHLGEALGVSSGRGLIRYVGVPEECLARGGQTVAGEMAEQRQGISEDGGEATKIQRRRTIRVRFKVQPSISSLRRQKGGHRDRTNGGTGLVQTQE